MHSATPSQTATQPTPEAARSSRQDSGIQWMSLCPAVGPSADPAPYMLGPMSVPSSASRPRWTPIPPISRVLVNPAIRSVCASRAARTASMGSGVVANCVRSADSVPKKWEWQSHMPGMTTGT